MDMRTGDIKPIGDFVFSEFPLEVTAYTLDDSRIVRYYVEALEGGRSGGFLEVYLGNLQYGAFSPADGVSALYQAEVVGDERDVAGAREALRNVDRPNLYGQGNLPIKYIERSILSNAEFVGYFGTN